MRPSGGRDAGGMRERTNRHAWRACVGQPTVGSNPTPSAASGEPFAHSGPSQVPPVSKRCRERSPEHRRAHLRETGPELTEPRGAGSVARARPALFGGTRRRGLDRRGKFEWSPERFERRLTSSAPPGAKVTTSELDLAGRHCLTMSVSLSSHCRAPRGRPGEGSQVKCCAQWRCRLRGRRRRPRGK